jgi:hypothetical protein
MMQNNEYLSGHMSYDKLYENFFLKNNFKVVFIIRDPRDQLVSHVYYIYKRRQPGYKMNFNDLLTHLIKNVKNFYSVYLPWKNSPVCYTTTFEKLVGPNGGGNYNAQRNEITNIAKHLNLNQNKISEVQNKLFGGTQTFREGKIGSWRKHFTSQHKKLFKQFAGDLVIKLGYEKNNNW